MDNQYHKLGNDMKNAISNGFNSTLDLTDNSTNKDSQRKLFDEKQWLILNNNFNKQKTWTPIDKEVQIKLKEIETLAATNIKATYKKCLVYQQEYAMEEEESFFVVYSHILKLLSDKKTILKSSTTEKFSEEDYIIDLWSNIFNAIFEDKNKGLICKWGESVPEDSSNSKQQGNNNNNSFTIGDKIDLRVRFCSLGGRTVDLISVEFSKDDNDDKIFKVHRKILREAKNNIDRFYRSSYMKERSKRYLFEKLFRSQELKAK